MPLTQDAPAGSHTIRSYGGGELRIDQTLYRGAIIVSASTVIEEPGIRDFEALIGIDPARLLALQPELVLLGTGERQHFPPPRFGATFLSAGIGFEAMDTGAACRTYNVLLAEQRRVVALLLA